MDSATRVNRKSIREMFSDVVTAASEIRVYGLNAAGKAAWDDASNEFISEVAAGNRTHGPTAVTVTFNPANGQLTATNLTDAFTDPDNGNGATEALLFVAWNGSEATSPVIAISGNPTNAGMAQDGVDDSLTFSNPLCTIG